MRWAIAYAERHTPTSFWFICCSTANADRSNDQIRAKRWTTRNDVAPFGPNSFYLTICCNIFLAWIDFFASQLLNHRSDCMNDQSEKCRHDLWAHDFNVGRCHRMLCIICYYCLSDFDAQNSMSVESSKAINTQKLLLRQCPLSESQRVLLFLGRVWFVSGPLNIGLCIEFRSFLVCRIMLWKKSVKEK